MIALGSQSALGALLLFALLAACIQPGQCGDAEILLEFAQYVSS
jgi:hypothetical protein